jgi:nucleotide-binding universal stress UspA family protein
MIRKIVVPLDGSALAESVIDVVEDLSIRLGVEGVTLLSVTERVQGYRVIDDPTSPGEGRLAPEAIGKMERQAYNYLNKIEGRLKAKGIKAETMVLFGDPAKEIAIYAGTTDTDLLVMSSHGRSGPSRWAHGSVTDKILKAVCVPVMVVRSPGCTGTL